MRFKFKTRISDKNKEHSYGVKREGCSELFYTKTSAEKATRKKLLWARGLTYGFDRAPTPRGRAVLFHCYLPT